MAITNPVKTFSQTIDGFQLPIRFNADNFRSALSYKPRDDDLFLVTYPKCGTTWTQHILLMIFDQGEQQPNSSFLSAMVRSPFLENMGARGAEFMSRPGVIKVHLPYHLTPRSDKAKYVYVARNPKDCCVSFFYQVRNCPGPPYEGTFDDFFELFISGQTDYGDYFDNLLGWYEHRNDPNVLFVTYEEMKNDIKAAILKMASFIDDEKYAEPLRKDPEKLDNIIEYTSFDYMKVHVNKSIEDSCLLTREDVLNSKEIPEELKDIYLKRAESMAKSSRLRTKDTMVRKGIIGDWRNHMSADQNRRLEERFDEKTKGTDIPILWKNMM